MIRNFVLFRRLLTTLRINEYYILPSHGGDVSRSSRVNNSSIYGALIFSFSEHHNRFEFPLIWAGSFGTCRHPEQPRNLISR